MYEQVNTNIDFGISNSKTKTSNSIGITTNNSSPTYQNTKTSNSNTQTETMDLSFATEQVTTESKSILDSVGDFFSGIGEGLKNTGATIVDGAKAVANWAFEGLKDLSSEIGKACSDLASNVSTILGGALSWVKDTAVSFYSTAAVIGTSVVSGIADIGEGIVDGIAWTGGKLVEGGSWLVGKVAGLFSKDAEESVMNWREQAKTGIKEFIATDWVGKANDWFYQETSLGQTINENSYLKYDSEIAQGIRSVSETVGKIALATAATIATGGAAAPLALGFLFGTGEQAEKLYQENPNTTGAQELGIFVSGLGEAANWYAQGKLGQGAVGLFNIVKNTGLKQTGALAINGVKSVVGNIKTNGVRTTIKGILGNSKLSSMMAADNLADSIGIVGDNVGDWLVGNEQFNLKTAASAGGELLAAWGLNMFFDGAGEYLMKGNQINAVDSLDDADELAFWNKKSSQPNNTPSSSSIARNVGNNITPTQWSQINDINYRLRTEARVTLPVRSSSELSVDMLDQIDDLSRVDVQISASFTDQLGNYKVKYNQPRYIDRITYTGYEAKSICARLDELQSRVDMSLPTKERAKQIYDILGSEYGYLYDFNQYTDGHKIGASLRGLTSNNLIGKEGLVCAGYAQAYKELCDRCNIPCEYITGQGIPKSGKPERHAWNVIFDDNGEVIPVDVTWNAGGNSDKWFGATDEFANRHIADIDETYKDYRPNGRNEYHNQSFNRYGDGYLNSSSESDISSTMASVISSMEQRMGPGRGIYQLNQYLLTGNPNLITRTNNARSLVQSLDPKVIKSYMDDIESKVGIIIKTMDSKYGYGAGAHSINEYLRTRDLNRITRTNGARDLIATIPLEILTAISKSFS